MNNEDSIALESNTSMKFYWLLNITEVRALESAVLSQNYIAFYAIHYTGIITIAISLISCAAVISSLLIAATKKNEKSDFSDRFPFYLAIADFMWGVSHLTDHLVVVSHKEYPSTSVGIFLAAYFYFFLGYQKLMHAFLAVYIYLKVVQRKHVNLGRYEWKLHGLCIGVLLVSILFFFSAGSFGCSGYWFLHELQSTAGIGFAFFIAIGGVLQSLCTFGAYYAIKREISNQNKLSLHSQHIWLEGGKAKFRKRHSTATQCLTTFILMSVLLYFPVGLGYLAFSIQIYFGVLEPSTILFIVLVANSSGWANALGYFFNKRLKARPVRKQMKHSTNGISSEFS